MKPAEIAEYLRIATGQQPPQEKRTIRDALRRLDDLSKDEMLPRDLVHYLSRRSYVKALEWLENPDMPHEI